MDVAVGATNQKSVKSIKFKDNNNHSTASKLFEKFTECKGFNVISIVQIGREKKYWTH